MRGTKVKKLRVAEPAVLKIDLGCGTRKKDGFTGADVLAFEGVDVVLNLGKARWPWADNSVAEAHCSHMLEHLTSLERAHFFNELYRVLAPGAKALVQTPYWASNRAYGDPTHIWPPVSEFSYFYLSAEWRKTEAPHTESLFTCDFKGTTWGFVGNPGLLTGRDERFTNFAISHYKDAVLDLVATLIK